MPGEVVWHVTPLELPADPGASLDVAPDAAPRSQVFVNRATAAAARLLPRRAQRPRRRRALHPARRRAPRARAGRRPDGLAVGRPAARPDPRAVLAAEPGPGRRRPPPHPARPRAVVLRAPLPRRAAAARPTLGVRRRLRPRRRRAAPRPTTSWPRRRSSRCSPRSSTSPSSSPTPASDAVRYRQLETHPALRRRAAREPARGRVACAGPTGRRSPHSPRPPSVGLDGPDEGLWSARLDRETDNLRGAVRTAVTDGDADLGLRLVVAAREWSFRHMRYELVRWAEEVVELPGAQEHPLLPTALAVTAYGELRPRRAASGRRPGGAGPRRRESASTGRPTGWPNGCSATRCSSRATATAPSTGWSG